LEITESVVVQDAEATIETLRALKALGVELAIDDFGTGYSSLSYLTRLTVDTLKVDRSFVSGANSDERATSIVGAVATLAHSLGMRVTAEGIETPTQLERMRAVGCDHAQGYYFAQPLPPQELCAWLERQTCDRALAVRDAAAAPPPLALPTLATSKVGGV
jgi:EAL domain-containing protein (putative c-di-GMP-specific phosphodiesterase class I)